MDNASAMGAEQRKYIRLNSVFPIQWRLMDDAGHYVNPSPHVGFTSNVSKGGLCLCVRNISVEAAQLLYAGKGMFSLDIEMPFSPQPIAALARVAWMRHLPQEPDKYYVGLEYAQIDPRHERMILRFARMKVWWPKITVAAFLLLVLAFGVNYLHTETLMRQNRELVGQLARTMAQSNAARQQLDEAASKRESLQKELAALQGDDIAQQKQELEALILQAQEKEAVAAGELTRINEQKAQVEKAAFEKMYRWLAVHQNPRTGLVMSFEGDAAVSDWGFIYDQSLAAQAYLLLGEKERAAKVLEFFLSRAERSQGLFYNAYYVKDGTPAEYTVHCGPNLWLGIAALQYYQSSRDTRYLALAQQVAEGIRRIQAQDAEGGLAGGPGVEWYSTEHNLDGYAFFDMLFKVSGQPEYAQSRDLILAWLVAHAYDKAEVPIRRGKGDSTIATDTYAWSIAAIGPRKLKELGMDPDEIMIFARQQCGIEVEYRRPDGETVRVRGFDFAPGMNIARGGVVSSEWTAQMVLSFKLMEEYHREEGRYAAADEYRRLQTEHLLSLVKMIISSPSPSGQGAGCLPYATQEAVDTGHGWSTPRGSSTGSIAGTAYTLFAYHGYNPLAWKE